VKLEFKQPFSTYRFLTMRKVCDRSSVIHIHSNKFIFNGFLPMRNTNCLLISLRLIIFRDLTKVVCVGSGQLGIVNKILIRIGDFGIRSDIVTMVVRKVGRKNNRPS